MIGIHLKMNGIHTDGITCIELIEENDAFITASFDFRCFIWSIHSGQKLGALLLGGDPEWRLSFNMEGRKVEASKEADELLERITKSKLSLFCMEGTTEEEQKELRNMKQKVLVDARELLDNQKKVS